MMGHLERKRQRVRSTAVATLKWSILIPPKETTMARSPKVTRDTVTEAVDAVQWTAHGDEVEAAIETRKRAKLTGPDCVAFLYYVLRTDGVASSTQRVRCASTLLEVGEFLATETKTTGLFRDAGEADGPDGRASS
jgi:hypothetical protein